MIIQVANTFKILHAKLFARPWMGEYWKEVIEDPIVRVFG